MILKLDFITNSSSSSFLVVWPQKVRKMEQLSKFIISPYKDIVYSDSIKQKPKYIQKNKKLIKFMLDELNTGFVLVDELIKFQDHNKQFRRKHNLDDYSFYGPDFWLAENDELHLRFNIEALEYIEKFIEQYEGQYLYIYKYADDDGEVYSELEHGRTFRNLPHIHISKH